MSNILFIALVSLVVVSASALASGATKVLVSGAGGRTGGLVFKKLLQSEDFSPVGVVRRLKSGKKLMKQFSLKPDQMVEADVTNLEALKKAIVDSGAEKYVLCTSAVPKIKIWSLIKVLFGKVLGKQYRPEFYFQKNLSPYNVDWLGAKNQIDAAKNAGIKHFIYVGSMGGTQPDNFLNTIGRIDGDELSGNILLWKRKAEEYLIASGMKYTIIHPGGLLDKAGGEREIVLGINDELLKEKVRSIPRDDVAEVCVQAMRQSGAINRSIDVISREPGQEGTAVTKDWKAFFGKYGNCKY
jgi:uncharacterized protein YbjT (DUF2867 family)